MGLLKALFGRKVEMREYVFTCKVKGRPNELDKIENFFQSVFGKPEVIDYNIGKTVFEQTETGDFVKLLDEGLEESAEEINAAAEEYGKKSKADRLKDKIEEAKLKKELKAIKKA